MGLFDFGSSDPTGGLYGSALTPEQQQAVSGRGLLGFLAGMQKSGALDYTVPFISGKVPGGLASGLAGGLGGMGAAQDEAVKNALNAQLVGLQGQNLQSQIGVRNSFAGQNQGVLKALEAWMRGDAPAGATPSGSPDTVSPNSPGAFVKQHESEGLAAQLGIDPYHIGVGGADLSKAPKDENGFPVWEGHDGSHAAGAYQFQPATWAQYAKPLGIKDFSQASQDAVFRAAYLDQGYKPWAPYNPKIAAAVNSGTAPHAPASVQLASLNAAAPQVSIADMNGTASPENAAFLQAALGGNAAPSAAPQMAQAAPAGVPMAAPVSSTAPIASPMPAAPAAPPMGGAGPMDAQRLQQLLPLLGAADATGVAAGIGNPYQNLISVLQGSPTYKAAVAGAEAQGKLPFVGPTAAAEAQGKAPFTWNTLRPGQFGGYGGNMSVAAPTLKETTDAAGNKTFAWVTPPLPSAPGNTNATPGTPPATSGTVASTGAQAAIGPGEETNLKARAEAEQTMRTETIKAGSEANLQQATLRIMKNEVPTFYTGPWSDHAQTAKSILRLLPGGDSVADSVAGYESFNKNMGTLTRQAVKDTSPRAAVQEFKLIGNALPNPDMSPIGLNRVLNEYMGLNDYRIAKNQAQKIWEQNNGGIGHVAGFETDWQAKTSPYAFIVARMDPADRQTLVSRIGATKDGKAELQRLNQQIQYVTTSGLDQFLQ